jgi:tetratricopeptide (TPR) repeat protein
VAGNINPTLFRRRSLFFVILLQTGFIFSQNRKSDSLWNVWNDKARHDTVRLLALDRFCWSGLIYSNPDSVFSLTQIGIELATKVKAMKYIAFAHNTQSATFNIKGDYLRSIEYQEKALKIWESIGNKAKQGACWYNMSKSYRTLGLLKKAIDCLDKALKLNEESNYLIGVGNCYIMLGLIHRDNGDFEKSKDYMMRSIGIYNKAEHISGLSYSYHNLGMLADKTKNYEEALMYYDKSLEVNDKLGRIAEKTTTYNNIGMVYKTLGKYDKALENYLKAKRICDSSGNKSDIAYTLINLGNLYKTKGDLNTALKNGLAAFELGKETGSIADIESSAKLLWGVYTELGDYKAALKNHVLYIEMRDSVNNEGNKNALAQQEYRYEYDKKSLTDSLNFAKKQEITKVSHQAQLQKEAGQRYILYVGMFFMITVGVISFMGYRRKKKDNILINEQKKLVEYKNELIEEKQRAIIDSITYAKRIQEAILPREKSIHNDINRLKRNA